MMKLSDFVEAHVIGIRIDEKTGVLDISMRLQNGDNATLRAEGVARLVAFEFREKNIIDRINVWTSQDRVEDFRGVLSELIAGNSDELASKAFLPAIELDVSAINKGEKILVEVEAVYGVGVIFLAGSFSLC